MAIAPRGFLHLWVQQALPGALAQAFVSHMAPGDPSGRTLSVTVNSVYLRGGGPAMLTWLVMGPVSSVFNSAKGGRPSNTCVLPRSFNVNHT